MIPPMAVLFDCDGVLVDSEPATFALLSEDFVAHGLTLSLPEMERLFIGGTIEGVAKVARGMGAALPDDWVESYYTRLYARLADNIPLIDGIPELLDALDTAGIGYAVGSNGRQAKMLTTLGQHPETLARFNGRLFSGQDLGCPKPKPDLYLHAANALGADPKRCVVIEDSPTGARAARAAGMRCLGYAPGGAHPSLAAEGAELFAAMKDVPALLGL